MSHPVSPPTTVGPLHTPVLRSHLVSPATVAASVTPLPGGKALAQAGVAAQAPVQGQLAHLTSFLDRCAAPCCTALHVIVKHICHGENTVTIVATSGWYYVTIVATSGWYYYNRSAVGWSGRYTVLAAVLMKARHHVDGGHFYCGESV